MVSQQEIAAAGGLWRVDSSTPRAEAVAEARELGIRALDVFGDVSFLSELPDLEFLTVHDPKDVAPIHVLSKLQALSFPGSWDGMIDGSAWPKLRRFSATEIPKDGGGVETLFAHRSVRSLGLTRPRLTDVRPIEAPRLESLGIGQTSSFETLAGIEQHASRLLRLSLWWLPSLESLDGLASLERLEVLDLDGLRQVASLEGFESLERLEVLRLEGLRHITSLEPVAKLPRLRFLDIFDLKKVESLAPLNGHPTLEFIGFGKTADLDLDPLLTIPNLKLFNTGSYRWNRDVHELPYLHDVPRDDPRRLEWSRLAVR